MSYIVRDEKGIMLMNISNNSAEAIIRGSEGRFRDYKAADGTKAVVFEILYDTVWTRGEVKIFLWAGTLLIPSNVDPELDPEYPYC